MNKIIDSTLDEARKQLGDLYSNNQIQEYLCDDILAISSNNKKAKLSHSSIGNLKMLCSLMNPSCLSDVRLLFSTACMLSIGLNQQTRSIIEMNQFSNMSLTQLLDLSAAIKPDADGFLFNYGSLDQLVNICQEKLIPKFEESSMDLKVAKDKYQKLIEKL